MATNSPIANLPRPELTDTPNAPAAFLSLTNALDSLVIPRFSSASARDLAIPAPVDGQHAFLTDSHALFVFKADLGQWTPYSYARAPQTSLFSADGTWLKPAGARSVWVRVQGSGGGGGGAVGGGGNAVGGSGGAGGYAESWYDAAALPPTVIITVGNAGTGTVGGSGGTGGQATFGGLITCAGGGGGGLGPNTAVDQTASAGSGGTATGGNIINVQGENGMVGQVIGGKSTFYARGGGSPFGSGGAAAVSNSVNGDPASGAGAGGGNAMAGGTSRAGGAGSKGVVIVTTFF
ncbi:glycine-rich domain-containing protein [Micromonospora sp. CB01531]|uniref:glycine-rich domain-containing protein n=1 Tax=Micromonospora sp. CB01531 TaxID=1718947 RepID=UPI000A836FFD